MYHESLSHATTTYNTIKNLQLWVFQTNFHLLKLQHFCNGK